MLYNGYDDDASASTGSPIMRRKQTQPPASQKRRNRPYEGDAVTSESTGSPIQRRQQGQFPASRDRHSRPRERIMSNGVRSRQDMTQNHTSTSTVNYQSLLNDAEESDNTGSPIQRRQPRQSQTSPIKHNRPNERSSCGVVRSRQRATQRCISASSCNCQGQLNDNDDSIITGPSSYLHCRRPKASAARDTGSLFNRHDVDASESCGYPGHLRQQRYQPASRRRCDIQHEYDSDDSMINGPSSYLHCRRQEASAAHDTCCLFNRHGVDASDSCGNPGHVRQQRYQPVSHERCNVQHEYDSDDSMINESSSYLHCRRRKASAARDTGSLFNRHGVDASESCGYPGHLRQQRYQPVSRKRGNIQHESKNEVNWLESHDSPLPRGPEVEVDRVGHRNPTTAAWTGLKHGCDSEWYGPVPLPPVASSARASHAIDIFIPEADPECHDEERKEYESSINSVVYNLKRHNISFHDAKISGLAFGNASDIVETAKAQCYLTLIVLCKAIVTDDTLKILGFPEGNYILLNTGCSGSGELLRRFKKLVIINFIDQDDQRNAMEKIMFTIQHHHSAGTNLAHQSEEGHAHRKSGYETSHISHPQTEEEYDEISDDSLPYDDVSLDERMNVLRRRPRLPLRFPTDQDAGSRVTTDISMAFDQDNQSLKFHRITDRATNQFVYVSKDLEPAKLIEAEDLMKMLDRIAKEGELRDTCGGPRFIARFVIPFALSLTKRQYIPLACIAADVGDPTVATQALKALWKLLVLRPHKVDERFVKNIDTMESILQPSKEGGSRWAQNQSLAIIYLEVYHLITTYIAIGSSFKMLSIKEEDLSPSLQWLAEICLYLKEKFASEFSQIEYHQKAIEYNIKSALKNINPDATKRSRAAEIKRPWIECIHRHIEDGVANEILSQESISAMVAFEKLALEEKVAMYHYCSLLSRTAGKQNKKHLNNLLLAMTNALLKKKNLWVTTSVFQGYVYRNYALRMENTALLFKEGPVVKSFAKMGSQVDRGNVAKRLAMLFYHPDKQIQDALASCVIKSVFSTVLIQECWHFTGMVTIQDWLCWYRVQLKMTDDNMRKTFSALWHKDNDYATYHEGSIQHENETVKIVCKMEDSRRSLSLSKASKVAKETLLAEIEALAYVRNQSSECTDIVHLLAYNKHVESGPVFYIFPCLNPVNCSTHLLDMLVSSEKEDIFSLLDICFSVLGAMMFCRDNKILVKSATSRCFLLHEVNNRAVAKLALPGDSILGKLQWQGEKDEEIPLQYSAPETVLECLYSERSMVYLTGMVLFEVLSYGVHPFEEVEEAGDKRILYISKYRLKPERRLVIPEELFVVLSYCWQTSPHKRGHFDYIRQSFLDFQQRARSHEISESDLGDKTWNEECQHLLQLSKTQPLIPRMNRPSKLLSINRLKDLWREEEEDQDEQEYLKYCCGDTSGCCNEENVRERDSARVKNGQWSLEFEHKVPDQSTITKLQQLKHENLVTVEVVNRRESRLVFNTESNTTVLKYMTGKQLPPAKRRVIYAKMAAGLCYLHEQGFLHCHITPTAFLINPDNGQVVLSNLGRATLGTFNPFDDRSDIAEAMCRPFKKIPKTSYRWLPAETISSLAYRSSTDVFSFGTVIWVLEKANSESASTLPHTIVPFGYREVDKLPLRIKRRALPQPSDNCPHNWYMLIKVCTSYPSWCRPQMDAIVTCLKNPDGEIIPPRDYEENSAASLQLETPQHLSRRLSRLELRENLDSPNMDIRDTQTPHEPYTDSYETIPEDKEYANIQEAAGSGHHPADYASDSSFEFAEAML